MEPDRILEHVRPLIVVVDGAGQLLDVRGAAGGLFGYRPAEMVGRNVLEFVAPSQQASVATYFVEVAGQSVRSVPMPMPFRTVLVDTDGAEHDVDAIPSGCVGDGGEITGWVVVIVPLALQSSPSRSLNAELSGCTRDEVRQRLTEELDHPRDRGRLLWFHVDLIESPAARVTGPRNDPGLGPLFQEAFDLGWAPWTLPAGTDPRWPLGTQLVGARCPGVDLPEPVRRALAIIDGNRLAWIPVVLDGETVGGYLEVASLTSYDDEAVKTNAVARMTGLLDVTRMLVSRWRDQDRLVHAATRDSLTGLANRDAFHDALAAADESVAVVYIDVDRFKDVNDRWGHAVGDRVLTRLAEQIESACRPGDVVARFGGDEFVVLLRGVDRSTAREIAERIASAASRPLGLQQGPETMSLSVGIALVTDEHDPVDVADRAMLSAKRLGRGRLVLA